MKKRKSSIKELKPNKIGFQSSISIYKDKFSNQEEITFKPKFSITKNITFASYGKIANNLAKAFKKFKPLKFWKFYLVITSTNYKFRLLILSIHFFFLSLFKKDDLNEFITNFFISSVEKFRALWISIKLVFR